MAAIRSKGRDAAHNKARPGGVITAFFARLFRAIGGPFRACARAIAALVYLTEAQIRALFSIGLMGGIVALSLQNIGLIVMVRQVLGDASPGSLFGQMALNQQWWNNAIMAGFGIILGLVVFGADWIRARWGGQEIGLGKADSAHTNEGAERSRP